MVPSSAPDSKILSEAISTLLMFAGPTGIIAVICAYLGYRKRDREELEPRPNATSLSLTALYSDRMALEEVARAGRLIVQALDNDADSRRVHARALEDVAAAIRENTEAMRRNWRHKET